MDALEALSASAFGELDSGLLQQLAAMGRVCKLVPGEQFQRRGDPVDVAVVVMSGALWISLSSSEGKRHVLRPLEPGQIFNLLPVMDGGSGIHDADAGVSTQLLILPKTRFLQMAAAQPALRTAIDCLLYARARAMYEGLAEAMLMTLRQRCARTLIYMLGSLADQSDAATGLSTKISQTELADMLGYSRPIVNRELMKLKEEGVIEIGYQRISVSQPVRLREIAGL